MSKYKRQTNLCVIRRDNRSEILRLCHIARLSIIQCFLINSIRAFQKVVVVANLFDELTMLAVPVDVFLLVNNPVLNEFLGDIS